MGDPESDALQLEANGYTFSGIAAGPEARLYREGLEHYSAVLKKALRKKSA